MFGRQTSLSFSYYKDLKMQDSDGADLTLNYQFDQRRSAQLSIILMTNPVALCTEQPDAKWCGLHPCCASPTSRRGYWGKCLYRPENADG